MAGPQPAKLENLKVVRQILDTADLQTRSIQTGQWSTMTTDREIKLADDRVAAMQNVIACWLAVDPHPEATWVQQTYGIPSLFVRFDCSIGPDGQLCFYEVEERPQGMGFSQLFNPLFGQRLGELQASWPEFVSVETPAHKARGGTDDQFWLSSAVALEDCPAEGLLLLRSEPHEDQVHYLAGRSVSTIATEGRKRYGVDLGWWREVSDPDQLPWDEHFVLKPLQGSKCAGVTMWVGRGNQRPQGASTESQVLRTLKDHATMLCQPYHAPWEVTFEERSHRVMLRPYFGFVPETGQWRYLGGEWLMAPQVKLHGSSETVFGPLT